jgi:predicted HTH transcriptional regulator
MNWSAESSGCDMAAIDPTEMARLRRLLRGAGREDAAKADDVSLLRDLRLMTRDGRITNAGLLLIGSERAIQRSIASYGTRISTARRLEVKPVPACARPNRF